MLPNLETIHNLLKFINQYGEEYLLPQNLSDKVFNRMIQEANTVHSKPYEETLVTTLYIAVLHLADNSKISSIERIEFAIHREKVEECINLYATQLRLEEMRRKGDLNIPATSFSTLANIFDRDRKIDCYLA